MVLRVRTHLSGEQAHEVGRRKSRPDSASGLLIADPTASSPGGGPGTQDTLLLDGISKGQLAANPGDVAFPA